MLCVFYQNGKKKKMSKVDLVLEPMSLRSKKVRSEREYCLPSFGQGCIFVSSWACFLCSNLKK